MHVGSSGLYIGVRGIAMEQPTIDYVGDGAAAEAVAETDIPGISEAEIPGIVDSLSEMALNKDLWRSAPVVYGPFTSTALHEYISKQKQNTKTMEQKQRPWRRRSDTEAEAKTMEQKHRHRSRSTDTEAEARRRSRYHANQIRVGSYGH